MLLSALLQWLALPAMAEIQWIPARDAYIEPDGDASAQASEEPQITRFEVNSVPENGLVYTKGEAVVFEVAVASMREFARGGSVSATMEILVEGERRPLQCRWYLPNANGTAPSSPGDNLEAREPEIDEVVLRFRHTVEADVLGLRDIVVPVQDVMLSGAGGEEAVAVRLDLRRQQDLDDHWAIDEYGNAAPVQVSDIPDAAMRKGGSGVPLTALAAQFIAAAFWPEGFDGNHAASGANSPSGEDDDEEGASNPSARDKEGQGEETSDGKTEDALTPENPTRQEPAVIDPTGRRPITDFHLLGVFPNIDISTNALEVEENRSGFYTVVLDADPGMTLVVTPTPRNSALAVVQQGGLSFSSANWNVPQTVTVSGGEDANRSDDATHIMHRMASVGALGFYAGRVDVTVLDGFSEVTIAEGEVTERDDKAVDMRFRVTINPPLTTKVGVVYYQPLAATAADAAALGMQSASPDADFQAYESVQAVVFPARTTSTEIKVRVLPDQIAEASELVRLKVGISYGAGGANDPVSRKVRFANPAWGREHYVHGIIRDDDVSGIAVSRDQMAFGEGREEVYQVVLESAPTAAVTITPSSDNPGRVTVSGPLVFTPQQWNSPQPVTVSGPVRQDDLDATATITHAVASADPLYQAETVADVSVSVNHLYGDVVLVPNRVYVDENGTATYRLKLYEEPTAAVTITPISSDPGRLSVDSAMVFARESWQQVRTLTVSGLADGDRINNATSVTHTVSSDDDLYHGIRFSGVEVVVVDDFLYALNVNAPSVMEGDDAPTDMVFTVSVTPEVASGEVEVSYTVPDMDWLQATMNARPQGFQPAAMDQDYQGQTQTLQLTIGQGQSSVMLTVPVLPDRVDEKDEAFYAMFDSPRMLSGDWHPPAGRVAWQNPTLGTIRLARAIIRDNDAAGVRVTPNELEIPGGGVGSYAMVLDSAPQQPVTITPTAQDASVVTVSGGAAASGGLEFTASNWNAPQSVTVSAIGTGHIGTQTRISHAVASTDVRYSGLQAPSVTVSISDPSPALLSVADAAIAEHPNGSVMAFPVTLSSAKPQAILVQYTTSDGTATAGDDYQAASGTLTIAAGEQHASVSVTVLDDVLHEGDADETLNLTLGSTSPFVYIEEGGGTDAPSEASSLQATGRIIDNDARPTAIALAVSPQQVLEHAGPTPITVTATLGAVAFDAARTVRVTVSGSGEDNAVPFAPVPPFDIALGAGEHTATAIVTVTPTNNAVDETDETITFGGIDQGANPIAVSPATLTLLDDDRPSVSIAPPEEDDGGGRPANVIILREGETKAYSLRFNAQPARRLSVQATSKNERAAKILSETMLFTELNWAATQKVTVKGEQDDNAVNETVTITHRSSAAPDQAPPVRPQLPPVRPPVSPPVRPQTPPTRVRSSGARMVSDVSTATGASGGAHGTSGGLVVAHYDQGPVAQQQQSQQSQQEQDEFASIDDTVVIVLDDDEAEVSVSTSALTLAEGATATYTARLTAQPSVEAVTVAAEVDAAFATASSPLTFTPLNWSTPQTMTITAAAIGDADTLDAEATISHAVSGGEYAGVSVPDVTLTITDPDVPTLTASNPTVTESEGALLVFDVHLNAADDQPVTVAYATAHGTTTDADAVLAPSGALTFSPGQTAAHVTITVRDDDRFEADETLTLTLTDATNAAFAPSVVEDDAAADSLAATGTIANDDAAPTAATLAVQPPRISEADGATEITVTATLSGATTFDAERTITLATSGSGAPGVVGFSPFAVPVATLTIAAGAHGGTTTFTLTPEDDPDNEADEMVTIQGTSTDGILVTAATLMLIDDDVSNPIIHLSPQTPDAVIVNEGDEAFYGVSLSSSPPPSEEITLSPEVSDGGAVVSNVLTFTADNWNAVQSVTVTGAQDPDAQDETVTITHRVAEYDGVRPAVSPVQVRVIDDETVAVTITPTNLSLAQGGTGSYTVSLSHVPTVPVTVEVQADASVATVSGPVTFTPLDWQNARTITVTGSAAGDADTLDAHAQLTHSVSGGAYQGAPAASVAVTVADPDLPTLSMAAATVTEAADAELRFTARIAAADDQTVTVQYHTQAGTATAEADYTSHSGTLTIDPGQTSATAIVAVLNDGLHEGSETLTLVLNNATNARFPAGGESLAVLGTITDDESMPGRIVLGLSAASVPEDSAAMPITVTATIEGNVPLAAPSTVAIAFDTTASPDPSVASHAPLNGFNIAIAGGATVATATFELQPIGDTVGGQADAVITVSGTHSAGIPVASTTLTVTDDDVAPTEMTLAASPNPVSEGDGTVPITVTATMSGDTVFGTERVVTVSVRGTGSGAPGTTSFAAVPAFPLTFPAAAAVAEAVFTLQPVDDHIVSAPNPITIDGDAGSGIAVQSTTLTLIDDDAPPTEIALAASPNTVSEGDGAVPITITATLSGDTVFGAEQTVTVSVRGSDAAGTTAFNTVSTFAVTFPATAAAAEAVFTLQPVDDQIASAPNTITIGANVASGIVVRSTTLTLTDDDAGPTAVTLAVAPSTLSESGGQAEVIVTASFPNPGVTWARDIPVTIGAASGYEEPGSAIAGADFTAASGAQLTIPGGAHQATGTLTLSVLDDPLHEGDETVAITGSSIDAGILQVTAASLTITDDDAAPTGIALGISQASIGEAQPGTEITVTAALQGGTRTPHAITITPTWGGTATAGMDYQTPTLPPLVIAPGAADTEAAFTLTPVNDTLDETDETIELGGTPTGTALSVSPATIVLTDDDTAGISRTPAALNIAEGEEATYTVSLHSRPLHPVRVALSVAGHAAAIAIEPSSRELVFPATQEGWGEPQTVTISAVADADTHDHTLTIGHTVTSTDDHYHGASLPSVTVTVTDPGLPILSMQAVQQTEVANTALDFEVRLDAADDAPVTVQYQTRDGTGAQGADYTAASGTLTIAAGKTSARVPVTILHDTMHEGDETLTLELTEPENARFADDAAQLPAVGTILDNDAAPTDVVLAISPVTVSEDDGHTPVTVTATLAGPGAGPGMEVESTTFATERTVTVSVRGHDGAGLVGFAEVADFPITIPPGATHAQGTFTVQPVDDNSASNAHHILISGEAAAPISGMVGDGAPAALTVQSTTLLLTDDDAPPVVVTLAAEPQNLSEGAGQGVEVVVTASFPNPGPTWSRDIALTATAATGTGTNPALAGSDFTVAEGIALTIPGGAHEATGTITLSIMQDTRHEGDETIAIAGATIDAQIQAVLPAALTLTDDDAAPTGIALTMHRTSISEADAATEITVTATPNGDSTFDAPVTITLMPDGDAEAAAASAGADYQSPSLPTLVLGAGAASAKAVFTLTPINDAIDEDDETIELDGVLTGTSVPLTPATMALTDDDTAGLTLTPETLDIAEGGEATYVVSLHSRPLHPVRVTLSPGGDVAAADINPPLQELVFPTTQEGWNEPQTVIVTAVADANTHDHAVTIEHIVASGDGNYHGRSLPSVAVSITDPELPVLLVQPVQATETAGAVLDFLVRITAADDAPVTVRYAAVAGTATEGADYAAASGTLTIAAGQTTASAPVTIAHDTMHEGNETLTLELTEPTNARFADGAARLTAIGTILDNDAAPTAIVLGTEPDTVSEGDGDTPVTVVAKVAGDATFAAERTVTVSVDGGDGAGLVGFADVADFPVTIPAGATSGRGTFTLQPVDDNSAADTRTIIIAGDTAADISVQSSALLLTDDDDPPLTITLAAQPQTLPEDAGQGLQVAVTARFPNPGTTWARDIELTATAATGTGANPALAGSDFIAAEGIALTIPGGAHETTGTITLAITQDTRHEGDETIAIVGATTDAHIQTVVAAALTLTDDDAAPTGIALTMHPASISEADAATEITVTATPSGGSTFDAPVTVTLSLHGDAEAAAASAGTDYQPPVLPSLVLGAGASAAEAVFTLIPINDAIDEDDETIKLGGTLTGASVPLSPATMMLTDDDTVGIALTPETLDITEGGEASYVVSLRSRPLHPVRVALAVGGDAAAANIDPSARQLVFPATRQGWDEPQTVTVTAVADADTHDHALTIDHAVTSDDDGYHSLSLPSVAVSITDPELPVLSVQAVQATEATGAVLDFLVRITAADDAPVTVRYAAVAGSATEGADYTAAGGTLTIAAGKTSASVPVTIAHDALHEGDETLTLELTEPSNARFADGAARLAATGTILDDDAAPANIALTMHRTSLSEADAATEITVTATTSGDTTFDVPVTITLSLDGDAEAAAASAGTDYQPPTLPPLTIEAGAMRAEAAFTLTPINDAIDEDDETITLRAATTDVSVPISAASLTLIDDDGAGIAITPTALALVEGDANADSARYRIALRSRPLHPVRVVLTLGGDADAVTIEPASRELLFPATDEGWSAPQTVTVAAVADADTHDHALTIDHAATSDDDNYHDAAMPSVTVIVTDPGLPTLSVRAVQVSEAQATPTQGAVLTFEVRLNAADDAPVTVRYATIDGTATRADYTAASGTLTIEAGHALATVPVTILHDVLHEGDETFTLELALPSNARLEGGANLLAATGTIEDDDAAPTDVALSLTPGTWAEGGNPTELTLEATLAGTTRLAQPITIALELDGTATADEDYRLAPLPTPPVLVIEPGAASAEFTLAFRPIDDVLSEGEETLVVTGTSTALAVSPATLAIEDDEGAPTLPPTDTAPTMAINEGDTATYTLMLVRRPLQNVTVTPRTSDAGAVTASAPLTFTDEDWNMAQTVTVTAMQDADAAPETATVTHQTSGGQDAPPTTMSAGMEVRVTDDETPHAILSPAALTLAEGDTATYTAVLGHEPTAPVTLDIAPPAIVDAPGSLVFDAANWHVVQTVTITGLSIGDDDTLDDTASITHAARGAEYEGAAMPPVSVTLIDPDVPALSIADAVVTEAEGAELQFEVRLDAADDQAVTVAYATSDGTANGAANGAAKGAAKGADYEALSGTLTLAAGASSATITVRVLDDDRYEGGETLNLSLGGAVNATIGHGTATAATGRAPVAATPGGSAANAAIGGTATGTIEDDEAAPSGITLGVSPNSVAEGSAATVLTITAAINDAIPFDAPRTVTVSFADYGANPARAQDGLVNLNLIIEAGSTAATATFTLQPADDAIGGQDDVVIGISGTDSGGLPVSPTTLTITDDDAAPSTIALAVNPSTMTEADAATQVTVTATVQGDTRFARSQTLDLALTGTALAGQDYAAVTLPSLVVEAGAAHGTAVFTVAPIDDAAVEETETLVVSGTLAGSLSEQSSGSSSGQAPGGTSTVTVAPATLELTDDDVDAPPVAITLSATPARIDEGNGPTPVTVSIRAAEALAEQRIVAVSVSVAATATTAATDGSDFANVPTFTLTIGAGQSAQTGTFTLTPIDDPVAEADETITIQAAAVSAPAAAIAHATAAIAPATITLVDNDRAGLLITRAGGGGGRADIMNSITVAEGDRDAYSVMLSSQPTAMTTVTVRSADADKMTASKATLVFSPGNWSQGQAVTVTGLHDDDLRDDEIMLMHESMSADAHYQGLAADLTVRVTDDDQPRLTHIELASRPMRADVFGIKEEIRLRLDFTRPVRVQGTPTLKLTLGDGERRAEYVSGASTNALVFTYTVQVGDRAEAILLPENPVQLKSDAGLFDAEETTMPVQLAHPGVSIPMAVNGDRDTLLTADAGDDIEAREESRVHLDGGGSRSAEPEHLAYAWAISEHHAIARVQLTAADTAAPTFVAPNLTRDTELTFILTVTNTRTQDEDTDAVLVTILAENDAPTAHAGEDQTVQENALVTLDGRRSSDPEGDPLSFAWVQADNGAPRVNLTGATSPTPVFIAPASLIEDAQLVFVLTVTDSGGAAATDQVTITTRAADLNPMMRHALAAFGRAVGSSAVATISQRLDGSNGRFSAVSFDGRITPTDRHPFTGSTSQGTANFRVTPYHGTAQTWQANRHFANRMLGQEPLAQQSPWTPSAFDQTLGQAFDLALGVSSTNQGGDGYRTGQGRNPAGESRWILWGRGDMRGLRSQPAANASLDGTVQANYLGIDHRWNHRGVAGLALSTSSGRIDYLENHITGTVQTNLRSVYPYAYWSLEQGTDLWGMVGIGNGTAHIATDYGRGAATDIAMRMLALGYHRAFLTTHDLDWSTKADAFLLHTTSKESDELKPLELSLNRLRLAAEAKGVMHLSQAMQLRPSGELAARLDGGDAETGLGLEMLGGMAYLYVPAGLTLTVRGRYLLAHTQGSIKQWGASMNVEWHPAFAKGFRLTLTPEWGAMEDATAALRGDAPTLAAAYPTQHAATVAAHARHARMNAELRHEFRIADWNLKPYATFGLGAGLQRPGRIGLHVEALEMKRGQLRLELFGDRAAPSSGHGMHPGLQATLQRTVR